MSNQLDHRQLADEMGIFVFNDQVGAGLPIWLPNGVAIRDELEKFIKNQERLLGYHRVVSPHIGKKSLFEDSGHLRAFGDNMFPPMRWDGEEVEYYLKPMNCPHHHKVYSSSKRSYRDLPLRIAEYGQVYRYENSGSLRGIIRARGLCQNDAHIYIDPKESKDEVIRILDLQERCYAALGLKGYRYRLSKHDPKRRNDFDGSWEDWILCEGILREALIEKGLPFFEADGEGAFYGPKIDVQMKVGPSDEESIASIQIDFNSAAKFDLKFVESSGESVRPWVIHRAPLGSHERFVALLLEYYNGQLPGWLSPIQLYLLPVVGQEIEAQKIADRLLLSGVRVVVDKSVGSLSKRIHFAHQLRPFAKAVVGEKEVKEGKIQIQYRDQKEWVDFCEIDHKILCHISSPK